MNKYRGLLQSIAGEFHIERGGTESEERWKARTVYSLLGKMAYASLSDVLEEDESIPEGDEPITITHFKRRMSAILDSYLELYPEIDTFFPPEQKDLFDEIYSIYLRSGCIYHTAYRILPAAPCMAVQDGVRFERGMPLDRRQYLSGLGAYLPPQDSPGAGRGCADVQEMFSLRKCTLKEVWDSLISSADWHPLYVEANMEYLPHRSPFYRWRDQPLDGQISIARAGNTGTYLYYLYQKKGGELLGSQLPHWLVNDEFYSGTAYRMVTNACLAANACLPPIRYQIDGPIIQMNFSYLPAPAELSWIKLYSWPQTFSHFPSDFERILSREVFRAVKTVLEQAGYQFTEE